MKRETKNAISDFIAENKRAPTPLEMRLIKTEVQNKNLPTRSLEGGDVKYQDQGSGEKIESLWQERKQLFLQSVEELLKIQARYEEKRLSMLAANKKILFRLNKSLVALDNILQMKKTGLFYAGEEETFADLKKVIQSETDAKVENGVVTLGKNNAADISIDDAEIIYKVFAPKGLVTKKTNGQVSLLKKEDKQNWSLLVYTDYPTGDVKVVVNVSFKNPVELKQVELMGCAPSGSGRYTADVIYAIKGGKTKSSTPSKREVALSNLFAIGDKNITSTSIVLSKDRYDEKVGNQYVYIFSLDQIRVVGLGTEEATESVILCGPYEFIDSENLPLNFSKVEIEPCHILPEGTSVSYSLSKDGISFYQWDGTPVVIGEIPDTGTYEFIDEAYDGYRLISDKESLEAADLSIEFNYSEEAVLNKYIDAEERANISETSIELKRGVVDAETRERSFYTCTHGWWPVEEGFATTVYVKEAEGREIDFGDKPVKINGVLKSGKVLFPIGYSKIVVFSANWKTIEEELTTEVEIRGEDHLYPYNHKYLIQGYNYPLGYTGEKLYNGFEEIFAYKLKYVSPELFSVLEKEDKEYFNCYTIEDREDGSFFLVKVDRSHSDWQSEKISATWKMKQTSGNLLYVKSTLRTSILGNTPIIESIKMRVA